MDSSSSAKREELHSIHEAALPPHTVAASSNRKLRSDQSPTSVWPVTRVQSREASLSDCDVSPRSFGSLSSMQPAVPP